MRLVLPPEADSDMSHSQPDTPEYFDLAVPTAVPRKETAAAPGTKASTAAQIGICSKGGELPCDGEDYRRQGNRVVEINGYGVMQC